MAPRLVITWAYTVVVVVVAVAALALAACSRGPTTCDELVRAARWEDAAARCLERYQQHGSSADGIAAARALVRLGESDEAARVARNLADSPHAGDAQMVLGYLALRRADGAAALAAYREADRLYRREGNLAGALLAANGLAGAWRAQGELASAMEASQIAIDLAERGGDLAQQLFAYLGRAELLREQGALAGAEADLERAAALARSPHEHAWIALKRGSLYLQLQLDPLAHREFSRVLTLISREPTTEDHLIAAHLNLAWLDRRAGALDDAMAHLVAAAVIAPDDIDVLINRALILADRGRLDDATAELARAAELADEDREPGAHDWWVANQQGLLAERRGDEPGARAAFQRSIEGVRALAARAGSYAPDVAASHRQPFLRLLGLHARRAEWPDALRLVMELDALALLATERSALPLPMELAAAGKPRPPADLPPVPQLLEAWRGRRLSILVSDERQLWRLQLQGGQVTGQAVGSAAELEALARTLEADPGNAVAAAALGAAIVPATGLATSLATSLATISAAPSIDVLLIGPLSRTPLAALTLDGRPLADRAPLVRVLGVLPLRTDPARLAERGEPDAPAEPVPPTRRALSVVLGDPRGDLPGARAEAATVAAALGATPLLGAEATRRALAEASDTGLLHVAAHAVLDARGPLLLLADGAVGRDELLARPGAPSVVVLASCGSAVARDDAGWGSLAGAYLAAGADFVIASAWSVDDASTRRFVEELYTAPAASSAAAPAAAAARSPARALVRQQPARALAAAQARTRATLPARVWAGFTVIAAPPRSSPTRSSPP